MVKINVDYARVGRSASFRIHLFTDERQSLHVGDVVVVTGDDVEERTARVVTFFDDDRTAQFEFVPTSNHAAHPSAASIGG